MLTQAIADKIEGTTLEFVEKTASSGRIYGSVGRPSSR